MLEVVVESLCRGCGMGRLSLVEERGSSYDSLIDNSCLLVRFSRFGSLSSFSCRDCGDTDGGGGFLEGGGGRG